MCTDEQLALRAAISEHNKYPGYKLNVPAMGHIFGPNLTCEQRRIATIQTFYRWRKRGRWHLQLQISRRRTRGEMCGTAWDEHQLERHPCDNARHSTVAEEVLPPHFYLPLTRATKWSRLVVAATVPR